MATRMGKPKWLGIICKARYTFITTFALGPRAWAFVLATRWAAEEWPWRDILLDNEIGEDGCNLPPNEVEEELPAEEKRKQRSEN